MLWVFAVGLMFSGDEKLFHFSSYPALSTCPPQKIISWYQDVRLAVRNSSSLVGGLFLTCYNQSMELASYLEGLQSIDYLN